ncbi:globin domain-containing protein [Boseongicola aestuarii]|jgi:hemoglobin-like flavoprotein|uniref:Flavohemoprotein n=1 Tax=Boseongicola aestuarii TaxID=1470561 RepID=A0A238J5U5_9RHOB|nr:globin domain-containing protein [Boseongicola aestuarii]SMX25602.1 Flavohemoprotein [Boseongicola aestuarii]
MSTETNEERLLKESFERLESDFDRFSTYFYDALFVRAPELRELFRDDLAGQGMRFMTTLRELVLNIQDANGDTERLAELGGYHANLGVRAENFAPMEEALVDTLRHTLRDGFTPELEKAWRGAYAKISSAMVRAGGIS